MKTIALLAFLGALISPAFPQFHGKARHPRQEPEETITETLPETPAEPAEDAVLEEEDTFYQSAVNRLATSVSNFGYDLLRQLSSKDANKNIFISPFGIATGLSELSLGASSRTVELLHRALFYHVLNDPEIHSTYKELLAGISGKGYKMATKIFLDKKLKANADFLNKVETLYGVRPSTLTGSIRTDVRSINEWIKQTTQGKVDKFLKGLPTSLSILLLSAAHFKGQWAQKLNPQLSRIQDFHLDDTKSVKLPMMSGENYPAKFGFDSELSCKITQLQLSDDVSMLIFLPNEITKNFTLIEETLSAEFIHDTAKALHNVKVNFKLPKMNLAHDADFTNTLSEMNLRGLFQTPDFSKIAAGPTKVTKVQHKAVLELDETGAEPTVDVTATANHVTLPTEYRVNKPFLFLLRDDITGSLLFIGKILDPKALTVQEPRRRN